jgi:hypothetical protein
MYVIIIIIIRGLGRLTCSGIDAIFTWGVHYLFSLEVCS